LSPERARYPARRRKETIMSDYDPNRVDPTRPAVNEAGYAADRGFNWSWIIGGIAAIVVLVVALSFAGRDDRTADTGQPAATTGQSSPSQSAPTRSDPMPAPNAAPTAPTPTERTAPPRPANPNQ
jgi:type IV secretory pathway VirB10-like protein